ncbi:MAG: hypothetical protein A2V76_06945 [Candidatus Aminicenantes bacterium RBG_16_63_14]|nr:MAG: hypothetical protein A2V76_06945 [Candidatus Aminicenantes bacterium RBG_16_63_14]
MTTISATLSLILSVVLAAWCFCGIVRRYRRISGFPWLFSLGFAAAATAAVFALHALLSR